MFLRAAHAHASTLCPSSVLRCVAAVCGQKVPLPLHSRTSATTRARFSLLGDTFATHARRLCVRMCSTQHARAPLLGGLDSGTSSTRFILFDTQLNELYSHQKLTPVATPHPGWVELDPTSVMESADECIRVAMEKAAEDGYTAADVKSIGIANQRESCVAWRKDNGEPITPVILWNDVRNMDTCENLVAKANGDEKVFYEECGLPISTYFSATKVRWMLDNLPEVAAAHEDDNILLGTVDSWLVWNLSGKKDHITDVTNASRTLLMNLQQCDWSEDALRFFGIKKNALPRIVRSNGSLSQVSGGVLDGVAIQGILGDQQAALVGHQCFGKGEMKNTYGTGCFMLMNTGKTKVSSSRGLLSTVAYQWSDEAPTYALEGSIAAAGSTLSWLQNNLGLVKSPIEACELAESVKDSGGIFFVPAFSGLFAPHWKPNARGTIVGLTDYVRREHICRATLDAMCFQSTEILRTMELDSGMELKFVRVDGGVSKSDLLCQIQANLSGKNVERPPSTELTAKGAVIAAGMAAGVLCKDDLEEVQGSSVFSPSISHQERTALMRNWNRAIERAVGWAEPAGGAPST